MLVSMDISRFFTRKCYVVKVTGKEGKSGGGYMPYWSLIINLPIILLNFWAWWRRHGLAAIQDYWSLPRSLTIWLVLAAELHTGFNPFLSARAGYRSLGYHIPYPWICTQSSLSSRCYSTPQYTVCSLAFLLSHSATPQYGNSSAKVRRIWQPGHTAC